MKKIFTLFALLCVGVCCSLETQAQTTLSSDFGSWGGGCTVNGNTITYSSAWEGARVWLGSKDLSSCDYIWVTIAEGSTASVNMVIQYTSSSVAGASGTSSSSITSGSLIGGSKLDPAQKSDVSQFFLQSNSGEGSITVTGCYAGTEAEYNAAVEEINNPKTIQSGTFGTNSTWSVADNVLTVTVNTTSDLPQNGIYDLYTTLHNLEYTNIVLKAANDVTFNDNVLWTFTENKTDATYLDLSNLTTAQINSLETDNGTVKVTSNYNQYIRTLKFPEDYVIQKTYNSNVTIIGGKTSSGEDSGSGDSGSGSGSGDSGSGSGSGDSGSGSGASANTKHVTFASTFNTNDVAIISLNTCSADGTTPCEHDNLEKILAQANITASEYFDKVVISGNATPDFTTQLANINARCINLDLVKDLSTATVLHNDYVKYIILPFGWEKDDVNNAVANVGKNFESAASANKSITGWKYIDPKTNAFAIYAYAHVVDIDGKKYGIPYPNYTVQNTLVSNCKDADGNYYNSSEITKKYEKDDIIYIAKDGANEITLNESHAYTKDAAGTTEFVSEIKNNQKIKIVRYDGSKIYGYVGSTLQLTKRTDIQYIYTHDGTTSAYYNYSNNLYSKEGYLYSLKSDATLTQVTRDDNGNYRYTNGSQYCGTPYKDEINNTYWIENSWGSFYSVENKTGKTVYVYNGNDVYTGNTIYYLDGNVNNPYAGLNGKEILVYDTYAYNGIAYNGPIYIDTTDPYNTKYKGIENWEENAIALEACFRYKYTDLMEVDHYNEYSTPLTSLDVSLSGTELYRELTALTTDDIGDKVGIVAYVKKPGTLAHTLKYMEQLGSTYYTWGNGGSWLDPTAQGHYEYMKLSNGKTDLVYSLTLSGNVFARDYATAGNFINNDGHVVTTCACKTHDVVVKHHYTLQSMQDEVDGKIAYGTGDMGKNVAFPGCAYMQLDLTSASFIEPTSGVYYPADMTVSYCIDMSQLISFSFPTASTHYIIPDDCMRVNGKDCALHEICIPCNYTEIHTNAFYCNADDYTHFTTTAASNEEQYGVKQGEVIDNGVGTVTLPSTLKFLATGSMCTNNATSFTDVFCLAPKAPVCEFNTFDSKFYVGNNSHDPTHNNKRGNYVNVGNGMCLLHFVKADISEQRNYTDLKRRYQLYDEVGGYDNSGSQYIWPTQAQYNRAYTQAMAGVTWDAWVDYQQSRADEDVAYCAGGVSSDHASVFNEVYNTYGTRTYWVDDVTYTFTSADGWSELWRTNFKDLYDKKDPEWDNNNDLWSTASSTIPEGAENPLAYDYLKYGGWHQFVLSEVYDFKNTPVLDPSAPAKTYYNFAKYSKNDWYSVCFPFDITKDQLLDIFGNGVDKYPYVVTLARTIRNSETNKITFDFSKNLVFNILQYEEGDKRSVYLEKETDKYSEDYGKYVNRYTDRDDDNQIVIEHDKPYLIYPQLPTTALAQAATGSRKMEVTGYTYGNTADDMAFPDMTTHVHVINGTYDKYVNKWDNDNDVDKEEAYEYYFMGNYYEHKMPLYAYYLGTSASTHKSTLFRNTKGTKIWGKNSCIILGKTPDEGYIDKKEVGRGNNTYYIDAVGINDFLFNRTSSTVGAKAAGFSFTWMDESDGCTTKILLPNDDGTLTSFSANAKVYNVGGQMVGTYSDNLPKGVYIIEGKKIVIK